MRAKAMHSKWRQAPALGIGMLLFVGPVAGVMAQVAMAAEPGPGRGAPASWLGPGESPALFAPLDDALPAVSLHVPAQLPIGQAFTFTVTFDNTSGTDTGYGPFVDLLFPRNGADGALGTSTSDGIDFVSATYLGLPLTTVVQIFPGPPGTTCVNHPYARDTTGAFLQVCGATGDKLVTLLLPFGSFTPTQPPAVITVNATLSNLADLGTPLTIRARGGFRFGSTPLDDWCCDPVIVIPASSTSSSWPGSPVTPTLITIDKAYSGPEDETATGPNFPRQYTITVTLPAGQTVTDLDVTDELPDNLAFLGVDAISPAGAVTQTPTIGAAANPPNNRLVVNFPSVTGAATVTFSFFVPRLDANGTPVLPPATGDDATSANRAGAVGDWTPVDPRDAGGTDNAVAGGVCPACAILHTLNDRSIAVQKGVTVVIDAGAAGASPGDTLEYTLQFQFSDFFAFEDVVLTDTFSDGQRFDSGFAPTLAVGGNGFSLGTAAINAANFDISCNYTGGPGPECTLNDPAANDGQTTPIFRVSAEVLTRGQPTGRFVGGCIDPTTGSANPDCNPANPGGFNDGPTTGTVVFRTVIQDQFTDDFLSGDPSVDQGDVLDDVVTIDGDVLNTATLAPTGSTEADASGSEVTVPRGTLDKSIYAVDGIVCSPQPCAAVEVDPGDTLTFRLQYGLPTSDFEDLSLTDFLPLPVLHATEIGVFDAIVDGTAPLAGRAKFGPADTFFSSRPGFSNFAPSIATDPVGNSVTFTYGDYDDPTIPPPSTAVDILFTVTVSNDPFTDQLLLTNQLRVHEGSTNATDQDADGIVQFILREPFLVVKKGVIATNNAAGLFTPATTGPVPFSGPGSPGTRFTPPIDSTNMGANPIDSNLGNVDAVDLISFAITIENQGSSPSGAFDIVITDTLPAGFVIPGSGLNLTVTRGDGSAVAFLGVPADLFGTGIELVDPGSGPGVCEAHSPTSGRNIIVLSYDLQIDPSAEPSMVITNTAEVTNYAGEEGGEDHTGPGSNPAFQDEADVTIASPVVAKTVLGTNQAHTSGLNVAIGELVQYRAITTIPEGTMTGATLVDTLDAGLAFGSLDTLTASPGLSTSVGGGFAQVLLHAQTALVSPGSSATFNFGTLTNSDTVNTTPETITLTYTVAVLNSTGNDRGAGRNNNAAWAWTSGTASGSAPNVVIVEPTLQVVKTALPSTGDAGDEIVYGLVFSHTAASNADAFEVTLSDPLPAGVTFVGGSLECASGVQDPGSFFESGGVITAAWASFLDNGTSGACTLHVTLDDDVEPGQVITNTANLAWSSLPGDVTAPQSAYNGLSTERTGDISNPGGTENDYRASGPATVTVFQVPDKSLTATSESHTGNPGSGERVAIGEIVRYHLAFQLAEGIATNLRLQDELPAGMQFLNDNTAMVALVSNGPGITSTTINSGLPGCGGLNISGASGAVTPTCPLPDAAVSSSDTLNDDAYGSGTDVYLKLGSLDNRDRDVDGEYLVVEFNALVENVVGNTAGQTLSNDFIPQVGTSAFPASNSLVVTVAVPSITLTKAVTTVPSDAGDTLVYTLTATNASGVNVGAAFDLSLADTIDPRLAIQSVSGGTTGGACGATPSTFAGSFLLQQVTATATCLNPGAVMTVVITVRVVDNVQAGSTIANVSNLTYTTLPGPNGTSPNPTLSTTPGGSGSPTGERALTAQANASQTLSAPTISKQLPSPAQQTIGGDTDYDLLVTLPEGATTNLRVRDVLPAGLAYVSHSVITSGAPLPADYNGTFTTGPACPACVVGASGVTLEFQFGDVQTNGSGPANGSAQNQFVIRVRARVLNVAANQNGSSLTNTASLVYVNPQTGDATVAGGSRSLAITEPELQVAKTADDATPAFGQVVTFTLLVSHYPSSTADAYDLRLTDLVPAGLSYVAGSLGNVSGTPAVLDASAAPTLSATWANLLLGASSTLEYRATVATYPTVVLGAALANGVNLTWTSLPGVVSAERTGADGPGGLLNDYATRAGATVTVTGPDVRVLKSDGRISASPSDTLTYTVTVFNDGNGLAPNVLLTDTLPANTTFVSASDSGSHGAGVVTWPTFNLAPATSVFRTVTVQVNNPLPAGANTLANTAEAHDDGSGGPDPTPGNNTATDVDTLDAAPDLTVTKDDGVDIVSPGSLLAYAINYANVGNQNATGVVITETVPAGTTFNAPASLPTVWTGCADGAPATSMCTYAVGNLDAGGGGTLTFAVRIDDPVAPGITQIVNTVSITDDHDNGPEPTPANNTDTDTDNLVTLPNADLAKTLADTSQTHTLGLDAAIGEILTYEVVMTIPPGSMPGAQLTDVLDRGLAFVRCVSLTPSPGLTTFPAGAFAAACANPTVAEEPAGSGAAEDQGRRVIFDLGSITSPGPGDGTLTLLYEAVVLDNAGNSRGDQLANSARWAWTGGDLTRRATSVTIVEPGLRLSKVAVPTSALPGTPITFTLTLAQEQPPSDSPAFDLVLEDTVPLGLTYVSGSLAATPVGVVDESAAPTLRVRWADFDIGDTATVTFQATLGNLGPGQGVTNSARLEWTSLPDDGVSAPFSLSAHNALATERFYDPGSAVNIYAVTSSATVTVPMLPGTGFAPGLATQIPPSPKPYADLGDLWLEIPSLDLKMPIVGVPTGGQGWDLTWLWDQAGYLDGTAFPTRPGNSALTGHVYLPNGKPGPFLRLKELRWGDQVIVHYGAARHVYEIRQVWHSLPTDLSVLRHEELPWLTLITCEGFDAGRETYAGRLVVRAVLVGLSDQSVSPGG